jgi:hypothetical protein
MFALRMTIAYRACSPRIIPPISSGVLAIGSRPRAE